MARLLRNDFFFGAIQYIAELRMGQMQCVRTTIVANTSLSYADLEPVSTGIKT